MGSTTPVYALPYPLGTDLITDGDNAMRALAERVEAVLATLDVAATVPSGFRNRIRNGDMSVAQRGNGPHAHTPGGASVGIDGWVGYNAGAVLTSVRGAIPATQGLPFTRFLGANMSTACVNAGDYCLVGARIEDVSTLQGQQVTLSFYAGGSVAGRTLGMSVNQYFGAGGSPSATTETVIGSQLLTAVMTRYTFTFTVPSIVGKTVGTSGTDYLEIRLWLGTGGTSLANSGLTPAQGLQAAWTLNVSCVQLEAGAKGTAFERLPIAQQLAWCQRYFYRYTVNGIQNVIGWGGAAAPSTGYIYAVFPVNMRAIPSFGNLGPWAATDRLAEWGLTALTLQKATYWGADLNFAVAGGMTARAATAIYSSNAAGNQYIEFSAEL